jgi:HAD superfamily phosphoserine phosphatase-like hydrolase
LAISPRGLVAFDLDGTILRGPTVCELLAQPLGRVSEMQRFESLSTEPEIALARSEMSQWYEGLDTRQLCLGLEAATWAPGARAGVRLLRDNGIEVVIASITWRFAVQWFATELGVTEVLGTELRANGHIEHVWPRDKASWLQSIVAALLLPATQVAAVGDSASDHDLLSAAALRFYVGTGPAPPISGLRYRPAGNIESIAREVISCWAA